MSGKISDNLGRSSGLVKAAGGGGKIGQVLNMRLTSIVEESAPTSFTDIAGLTLAITPTATSSKILFMFDICCGTNTIDYRFTIRVLRGSTVIAQGDAASARTRSSFASQTCYSNNRNTTHSDTQFILDDPSTTSAVTYKLQCKMGGSVFYLNKMGEDTDNADVGRGSSSLTLMEVLA